MLPTLQQLGCCRQTVKQEKSKPAHLVSVPSYHIDALKSLPEQTLLTFWWAGGLGKALHKQATEIIEFR